MPWSIQCAEDGCHERQDSGGSGHLCCRCGGLLEVVCDLSGIEGESLRTRWLERRRSDRPLDRSGVWRFRELVDFFDPAGIVSLSEGRTALLEAPRAARWAGVARLHVKQQGGNPTGSFKDLGMTVAISRAVALGVRVVACASTGNTSSSMAAYAARAGLKALIFVPAGRISSAKLAQALDFGATVVEVGENFDRAFELVSHAASELGLYLVNSVNPFRIEGQKTLAAELLEQRDWSSPDYIVVPGGNLGNTSAIGKGLHELAELGLVAKTPRMVVVQAAGASAFFNMISTGRKALVPVENPETEATAIRIGNPANWKKARRVLEETSGLCESVTDAEIFAAKHALAGDGIGAEPASAATLAGIRKLRSAGRIEPGADVVAVLTGHQLKDPDYVARHAGEFETGRRIQVEADPEALRRAVTQILEGGGERPSEG
ncbi:MAG TPA: threonine synthase [Terriglobia bacterium]|nr:threonine synthase [Terriglobia bacterium]